MIEKDIEAAIIDKIKGLDISCLDVQGLWQPSIAGTVKNIEQDNYPATVLIKIPPCGFETFGICEVSMEVSIVLSVRIDMCPTGQELVDISTPISNMIKEWNLTQSGEELVDLTVNGFYPGGITVNGGSGPDFDRQNMTWTVLWNFTLRGTVSHEEQT